MSCSDEEIPRSEPAIKYRVLSTGKGCAFQKIRMDHDLTSPRKRDIGERQKNPVSRQQKRSYCGLGEGDVSSGKKKTPDKNCADKLNDHSITELLCDSESSVTSDSEDDYVQDRTVNAATLTRTSNLKNDVRSPKYSEGESTKISKSNVNGSKIVSTNESQSKDSDYFEETYSETSPRKNLKRTSYHKVKQYDSNGLRSSLRKNKPKYDSNEWEVSTITSRKEKSKYICKAQESDENVSYGDEKDSCYLSKGKISCLKNTNMLNVNDKPKTLTKRLNNTSLQDESTKICCEQEEKPKYDTDCGDKIQISMKNKVKSNYLSHDTVQVQKKDGIECTSTEKLIVSQKLKSAAKLLTPKSSKNIDKAFESNNVDNLRINYDPKKTSTLTDLKIMNNTLDSPNRSAKNLVKTPLKEKSGVKRKLYNASVLSSPSELNKDANIKKKDSEILRNPLSVIKVGTNKSEDTSKRKLSVPQVPRTTEKLSTPGTPSCRDGRKRQVCTPSMPACKRNCGTPQTPLQEAMARLHVSAVPHSLPCRETEFENVHRFLEGKILDGAGGCIYVSGVPGTGKTATVRQVVQILKQDVQNGEIPDFKFIEVNGMRLSHPRQVYVQLWKSLTGDTVTSEQAQRLLENRFTKNSKVHMPIVVLIDEVDVLWTRRQDVIYNLLDWPSKAKSHLVVITIANTMDLPERLLMGRVTSRLGLTRLTFQPYTHKQLEEIVKARLTGVNAFDADAIQFVSRKVASVSGDARRALDICRRATEIAEQESPDALVTIKHVDDAMLAMTSSHSVQAITLACSTMEKLFLQAVEAELTRTGLEETTFGKTFKMMETLCSLEGFALPSVSTMMRACMKLCSMHLLLVQNFTMDIYTRIFLNVSVDDLHYALKCSKR